MQLKNKKQRVKYLDNNMRKQSFKTTNQEWSE